MDPVGIQDRGQEFKDKFPLADGTEKAAPKKSAERLSQTKLVFGINTDFLGWTKYPRATLRLTTTKAAAPGAEANGCGCPVRVFGREIAVPNASSSRNRYRRPKRRRKPATSPEKHV